MNKNILTNYGSSLKWVFILMAIFCLINTDINAQIISNNGAYISITAGTVLGIDTINNTNTAILANDGTINLSTINNAGTTQGNGTYNISKIFTNTGTFAGGTSTVNYNGTGAQTIIGVNYYNLTTSSARATNSITYSTSGIIGIAGAFSPAATFTSGSNITSGTSFDFNGRSAQNIPAFNFENVTFSGGNTKTAGGNINVLSALILGANTNLALSTNNITLKSSATNTARVAQIPTTASITYGTGKFIVERYVPGRRKYRLITSSVTTSTDSTLTTGQESLSIWGNWQNQGGNTANVGTIITGGNSIDGYDQQTTNASLYTYNFSSRLFTGFTSANGKNTKYTPLKAGVAYYMFVYGDRTNTIYTSTPNYTTLRSAGTLLTGDQTYTTSSTIPLNGGNGIYTLLGNPFASPIDWSTLPRTNLSNTYWGWDPNLSSTGGYVTVSTAGSVTLISPFSGTTGLNQYIQSGQGFFVQATAASPSLTIREQDKVSNYNTNAFRTLSPNSIPLIAINLLYNTAGSETLADGALVAFDANFSNSVTNEDASKIMNAAENVSLAEGNSLLSIDERKMPKQNDTLFLNITKLTKPQYTLQIFSNHLNGLAKAYLEDKYLKKYLPLSLTDTNRITVNISSDAASYVPNRFRIVFEQPSTGILTAPTNNVKTDIKVFPNPIKDQQINFELKGIEKGEYNFIINNSIGQQIFIALFNYDGRSKQNISLTKKLPAGIYYLQIANKTKSFSKTIWVQ